MGRYSEFNEDYDFAFDDDSDANVDMDGIIEAFLIDDLTHNYSEEAVKEFCEPGGVGDALLEAKVLSTKRTMLRLSKQSDLDRRRTIVAINMAKAKRDPLYAKLVKYQKLRKEVKMRILEKYGNAAARTAIKGQKAYMKTMRNVNLANSGTAAFITKDPNRHSN